MFGLRRWRWLVAALLVAVLLSVADGFGRTAYAQQAADGGVTSAEQFCWVTGVVEDKSDPRVLDRSFGGQRGHLATDAGYTQPSGDGFHAYTHQEGSDGKDRRFGDWFDWVYQEALRNAAGRAQWQTCSDWLERGAERAFVRPMDGEGLLFAEADCAPGSPTGSDDWVVDLSRYAMADDDKDFGDYAGGYGDMTRPWRQDAKTGELRPVGVNEQVATGPPDAGDTLAALPNPVVVAGVSHPTRAQLVDFLFFQDPPAGDDADIWRKVRGEATTHGSDWSGTYAANARWSTRSVGVPDGDVLESVQVRWIDPANPEGGDQVDPALLALQQQAAQADIAARQDRNAEGGNRVTYGTEQGSATSLQAQLRCTGNTCTQTLNSSLVSVENTAVAYETNNGEVYNASLDRSGAIEECTAYDNAGACTAYGERLVGGDLPLNELEQLAGGSGSSLRATRHPNTDADRLWIKITLRQDYRQDLVDHDGHSFARFGAAPGLGERVIFDTDDGGRGGVLSSSYGYYRQSLLSPPVSLPGSYWVASHSFGGGGNRLLPESIGSYRTSVVRWPVFLKDMAWYLFELPEGDGLEAGEAFPAADGTLQAPSRHGWRYNSDLWEWTARSAYGIQEPRKHYPQCRPHGDNPSEGECEGPSNQVGDEYQKSDAARAFFPFYVSGGLSQGVGTLHGSWLRKAGVAGPTDAEDAGFGRNNEFVFEVVEGDRYSEFAQDNEGAAALSLARVGQPPAGYHEGTNTASMTTEERWRQHWEFRPVARPITNLYPTTGDVYPNRDVDPNRMHLLVLAFYEVRHVRDIEYQQHRSGADDPVVFRQPVWQVRRVLCRVVVGDLASTSGGSGLASTVQGIKDAVSAGWDGLKNLLPNWVWLVVRWVTDIQNSAVEEPMRAVCAGASGMAGVLGEPDIAQLGQAQVRDGAVEVSVSREAELRGRENCEHQVEQLPVAVAAPVAPMECEAQQVLVDGVCWGIPKPDLERYQTKWVLPGCYSGQSGTAPCEALEVDAGNEGHQPGHWYGWVLDQSTGRMISGGPAQNLSFRGYRNQGDIGAGYSPFDGPEAVGLASTELRWRLPVRVNPEQARLVSGWVVYVKQDPKMVRQSPGLSATDGGDDLWARFVLDRLTTHSLACDPATGRRTQVANAETVTNDRLSFGDLPEVRGNWQNRHAACPRPEVARGLSPRQTAVPGNIDSEVLDWMLQRRMPVAPGFRYEFKVAAYAGAKGTDSFVEGPASDVLVVDGDSEACYDLRRDMGQEVRERTDVSNRLVFTDATEAYDNRARERAVLNALYDCVGWDASGPTPSSGQSGHGLTPAPQPVDTDWMSASGALTPLVGSDVCRDIFTGTPARYTWDNPVVRSGWRLVLVVAMIVLPSLLMWQGIRMVYDVWVDPRPSYGFREMIPRFGLSIILVAGSLYLCQMVLMLVNDLGCFVGQATGMTLWGFLGNTMGGLVEAYMSNAAAFGRTISGNDMRGWDGMAQLMPAAARHWSLQLVMILGLVLVLILWVLVVIKMMTRIVLLGMLVVFSPIAFAFYAAPATEHWTKKWLKMFLGTCFEQSVVLIVLYVGGSMMEQAISFQPGTTLGADEPGLLSLVLAIIMGFLSIFLALKAPSIVNPDGQGMFDSVRSIGMMAIAAGVAAMTAGAGLAVAGLALCGAAPARAVVVLPLR